VGGTRVRLESVIAEFQNGATPEQIVQDFDSLTLADVYAVITYYLRNRADVDAYIEEQRREGDRIEGEVRASLPHAEIRERLLARRRERSS
jgi:uncharacterized protein (DUF433 family)